MVKTKTGKAAKFDKLWIKDYVCNLTKKVDSYGKGCNKNKAGPIRAPDTMELESFSCQLIEVIKPIKGGAKIGTVVVGWANLSELQRH